MQSRFTQAIQAAAHAVRRRVVRHGGTACRYGDHRLGLILPNVAEEQATMLLASEISRDLEDGPKAHIVTATWRPGDTGDDLIDRAPY